jgi:4-hydroxy-tetrahydrodipicolinate synthase
MPDTRIIAEQLKEKLAGGLIPAVPVMFDRAHRFHERAHASYVDYMRTQPIAGVAVWAHTGRGLHLTKDIARKVIDDWREALPNKPLIAGVGADRKRSDPIEATEATLSMAADAAQYGADAVLAYPPTWLREHKERDRLIVEHHARLDHLGLPIILFYLYEAAGGIPYNANVLDELLSLPNVVGIKMATLDSVVTYQDIARHTLTRHPDKLLITGEDRFLAYSLRRGASAALIGMGAVCCELQAELLRSHFEGRAERFLELSDAVDELAEVLFATPMEGYIGRILCALAKLGIIPEEAAYDPWGPSLTESETEKIETALNLVTASYAR